MESVSRKSRRVYIYFYEIIRSNATTGLQRFPISFFPSLPPMCCVAFILYVIHSAIDWKLPFWQSFEADTNKSRKHRVSKKHGEGGRTSLKVAAPRGAWREGLAAPGSRRGTAVLNQEKRNNFVFIAGGSLRVTRLQRRNFTSRQKRNLKHWLLHLQSMHTQFYLHLDFI